MSTQNKTIVHFHTGRGGQFNNPGYVTFCGTKDIYDVLSIADKSGHWNFLTTREADGKFCSPYISDSNGNFLISKKEVDAGIGRIEWDGQYDTDVCMYLSYCGEDELRLIANSDEWNKEDLIREYFDQNTELAIDWSRFDGRYADLITDYFNFPETDIEEFYKEIE